eukprot:GHRQ01037955.1.p1 GENE.GHRQ01037955.1~~GHRQ01037955.1.p1  ORF type:complete len:199 (+),score=41.96 GHRQ01037955.1:742-1338(+)
MRQGPQESNQPDETVFNDDSEHKDPGHRAAGWCSGPATSSGKQPELGRSNSAASSKSTSSPQQAGTCSIRQGRSRLPRQDTALSVRWGHVDDVDYEELTADLPAHSLFLLGKQNPLRKAAVYAITNKYFDYAILAAIIANCVTLGMYSHQPGFKESPMGQFLQVTEYCFLGVFSVEMLLKVLAMGLVLAPGTYLRSGE